MERVEREDLQWHIAARPSDIAKVARHDNINIWNFAHDARQERPECIPGALNLLRRLAVDQLRSLGRLVLPKYQTVASRALPSGRGLETVEWDAQPVEVTWLESPPQGSPVACMVLDNEVVAELFVEISDLMPTIRCPSESPDRSAEANGSPTR